MNQHVEESMNEESVIHKKEWFFHELERFCATNRNKPVNKDGKTASTTFCVVSEDRNDYCACGSTMSYKCPKCDYRVKGTERIRIHMKEVCGLVLHTKREKIRKVKEDTLQLSKLKKKTTGNSSPSSPKNDIQPIYSGLLPQILPVPLPSIQRPVVASALTSTSTSTTPTNTKNYSLPSLTELLNTTTITSTPTSNNTHKQSYTESRILPPPIPSGKSMFYPYDINQRTSSVTGPNGQELGSCGWYQNQQSPLICNNYQFIYCSPNGLSPLQNVNIQEEN